jgi:hypothetical protein
MNLLSLFQNKPLPWNPADFPKPWQPGRPAIFDTVRTSSDSEADLPDKDIVFPQGGISWVGGAMDNLTRGGGDDAHKTAARVYAALKKAVARPTQQSLESLYVTMARHSALTYVDSLMDFVGSGIDGGRLEDLMRWLAQTAPDREVVKAAIALLGIRRNPDNAPLFSVLGGHEEFALFANVALTNSLDDPEPAIWDLAQRLQGWGKIDSVLRLSSTDRPDIKAWLLRKGCRTSVMNEYLAYTCANSGDLLTALKTGPVDDELLEGA